MQVFTVAHIYILSFLNSMLKHITELPHQVSRSAVIEYTETNQGKNIQI